MRDELAGLPAIVVFETSRLVLHSSVEPLGLAI